MAIQAFRILDQNARLWYISSAWLIRHANDNSHDIKTFRHLEIPTGPMVSQWYFLPFEKLIRELLLNCMVH